MLRALRIPELAQRDRFLRQALAAGRVFAVAGQTGIAHVDSPHVKGAQVALLWSTRSEAARWAGVLVTDPRIVDIALGPLIGRTLPDLAAAGWAVGPDWSADPIEPEVAAADLATRLRLEALDSFTARARGSGTMWILEDAEGPAVLPAGTGAAGAVSLPVWTSRADAERSIAGAWSGAVALSIPLDSFRTLTAPWLQTQGWQVAAATADAAHGPEFPPADIASRLKGGSAAA